MLGPDPNKELLKDSTRLAAFLQECLLLGSLRGFKHFDTFVRGREELVLFVYSDNMKKCLSALMPLPILETYYSSKQVLKWNIPELISPLDTDLRQEKERTVFLVAGYAKYRCPYVWLRSHQDQLILSQPDQTEVDDNPLQLAKTTEWKNKNVALWEIVSEILSMTANRSNPFELDFLFIDNLPLEEAVLLTGSLLEFLETVWVQADPSITFSDKMYQDIQILQSRHVDNMYKYTLKTTTK
ncbi:hypothetical protein EDC94DRAFT_665241 [Helicostylum pulchrum]|uniref:DUF7886 domain-containing protein n=1 Tax=Helicostylum pulchrum TaxID=562976 RepID=A0ABP9YF24_9FUNG|nr:hypothetical protein EDC94DRAFT_665241 [Helicostylum pulchrum]